MAIKEGAKLVKFENKLFEVTADRDQGIRLTPISDEDVADSIVLNVDIDAMRHFDIEETLEKTKEHMLKDAKQNLRNTIWAAMGFDTKWSEWTVKEHSVAATLISSKVKDFILNEQLTLEDMFAKPEEKAKLKQAIESCIKSSIKRCLEEYRIDRMVENMVREQATTMLKEHVQNNMAELLLRTAKGKKIDKNELLDVVRHEDGTITLVTSDLVDVDNEYLSNDE